MQCRLTYTEAGRTSSFTEASKSTHRVHYMTLCTPLKPCTMLLVRFLGGGGGSGGEGNLRLFSSWNIFFFLTSWNKVLASVLSEPWFFSASYSSTMKMEADGSFETAVNFHNSSWCQMSADIVRDSQSRQNLTSQDYMMTIHDVSVNTLTMVCRCLR